MRVVAGSARGRRLRSPEGVATRPTTDRVREAVFNAVYSLGGVQGATVVDLFAGTGAMGIEALSRGADRAVFVENDAAALEVLRDNIDRVGFGDRAEVVRGGVERYAEGGIDGFDLVVIDPPYDYTGWAELLGSVSSGLVVIESDREVEVPDSWTVHRTKRYGSTVVMLGSPATIESTTP